MSLTLGQRMLLDKLYQDICNNDRTDWDLNAKDYFLDLVYILKFKED